MALSEKTSNLAKLWLQWDINPTTRKAISDLVDQKDEETLKKLLWNRIDFGTAGLRGKMREGFSNINDLTVIQTSQGLSKYVEATVPDALNRGICIGFDGRYHSKSFAMITAATFLSLGFKVYLFNDVVPTPIVAFTVVHRSCACGVMITASHNPKDDNGYKVYWENGCQIIEPHDDGIRKQIHDHLEPWKLPEHIQMNESSVYKHVMDPSDSIQAYTQKVQGLWNFYPKENSESDLRIAYTAMHGVGSKTLQGVWSKFGFKPFFSTPEQDEPNPDFPTVVFPNPEEGKGSLKLAIENAEKNQCTLILANDPDADRLAVAEKDKSDHSWRIFTGNEIGILLADWVVSNYIRTHPDIKDHKKLLVLNSTVSSKMISSLARHKGLTYEETLTGFKWIGNKCIDMERNDGYIPLFGFEEAIGFMVGGICWDKDGISGACVFGEMSAYYHREGINCYERLCQLQEEYGLYLTKNSYFFCYEPEKIKEIFDGIRNDGMYVKSCGKYEITSIRDLTTPGYDSKTEDHRPTLPISSSTQMITFEFKNGAVATLRGSGTEPKLKYYVELCGKKKEEVQEELDDLVEKIIETCLKPLKYGLVPPDRKSVV